jgi:hypothetical protein
MYNCVFIFVENHFFLKSIFKKKLRCKNIIYDFVFRLVIEYLGSEHNIVAFADLSDDSCKHVITAFIGKIFLFR